MRPMEGERTDLNPLDALIQFDCRVRRWLGGVPLSTIVVLVDAVVDEMEVRARASTVPRGRAGARRARRPGRRRGRSTATRLRAVPTSAPEALGGTLVPS